MPRFNVQDPVTKKWNCNSTISEDFIKEWEDEDAHQMWRILEYGRQAGPLREANIMSYEEALERKETYKQYHQLDEEESIRPKPCPKCGGEPELRERYGVAVVDPYVGIYCLDCGFSMRQIFWDKETVIKMWNEKPREEDE